VRTVVDFTVTTSEGAQLQDNSARVSEIAENLVLPLREGDFCGEGVTCGCDVTHISVTDR
jgi:hypothetical protein